MSGTHRAADVNVNEKSCAADADEFSSVVTAVGYNVALGVRNL